MVTFNTSLSPTSLNNLAKNLKKYYKDLELAKTDILQALTDYTYERIMYYVPVKTGTLMNSFASEVSGDIGRVYTDLYYAKYVEFGTGIKGTQSNYNVSKLIVSNGWKGYSEDYENGQVAQKFMYKALQDVEANYKDIVKNMLKQKGLI